ncbi:aminoglycoside 3-N-acetyltransferase [Pelagibacterium halotolerans]|uniref:aminoglycoside 3-N-acetyltransferase n=1 Tax=Pelagibacterium halotolerans TaxID=531813 RepID=UPI003850BB69
MTFERSSGAAPRTPFMTRAALVDDLRAIGLAPGDIVLVHAALSKVGPLLNGPDAVIGALLDTVGPEGTVMGYTDWDAHYEDLLDAEGRVPDAWKSHIPPFDPLRSRSVRDNGAFPEFLRTTPGALRSGNPGASMAALGAKAEWLTADHPLDYGYGEGSPLAKLVETGGKVLMLGAPRDTMTLIHHAEHLARLAGKRIKRVEVPFATDAGTVWRWVEEFDTGDPVIPALDGVDYFTEIVTEFLEGGSGRQGKIGHADSILVDAAAMTAFAVDWLESRSA